MKTNFICPKCRGYLNVGDKVIFSIKNKHRPFGLILLSPVLGDYKYEVNPSYEVGPGEEFDFHCPNCHKSLHVSGNEKFVRVVMIEDDNIEHWVVFSRKEGEQCTYKISDDSVTNYGADSHKYIDFLSASMLK